MARLDSNEDAHLSQNGETITKFLFVWRQMWIYFSLTTSYARICA